MQDTFKAGIYRHYKGKYYDVMGVARHSETLELMAVYRALYESSEFGPMTVWTRPLSMFLESVESDGASSPRFAFVCNKPSDFK